MKIRALSIILLAVAATLTACHTDMYQQPRYEPLEDSAFFSNGMSARNLPAGTVPRGALDQSESFNTGRDEDNVFLAKMPVALTAQLLNRGAERFGIYCTPCHGVLGDGNGKVVERGFKRPATFHSDRLRGMPDGYFFDVMTNGFGVMFDYRARVKPADRWAIVAYIRALQLSQNVRASELSAKDKESLK